jgi:hypothetical protein
MNRVSRGLHRRAEENTRAARFRAVGTQFVQDRYAHRRGPRAEAACVGTPGGGGLGGRSARGSWHSGMRYAVRRLAAISFGLRQALRLWLRIADSLGQHLAKLGLSLWRFAREGFCPCRHEQYVGMREKELNPYGRLALALKLRNTHLGGGHPCRARQDAFRRIVPAKHKG